MSRIRKAYEARYRAMLLRLRARRLEPGVNWLLAHAVALSRREGAPVTQALGEIYERLRRQVARWELRSAPKPAEASAARRFLCDAGLGGLARWLRAAGYDARWLPDATDDEVIRQAREADETLLTTDSLMMQRRVLRDGVVPALWLPPTLTKAEQLSLVLREFGLGLLPPRCMSCGGELRRVDKQQIRERIPPRTFRWLEEYFVCARCHRLFWHGTHWQKIQRQLNEVANAQGC